MKAEVISIGDELTSGNRLDTNSQWISQRLGEIGIQTAFHSTVGDCLEDNINVFQNAARRSDIVIATGGLGPTADDLTREVIASAFNAPLELRTDVRTSSTTHMALHQGSTLLLAMMVDPVASLHCQVCLPR